MAKVNKKPFTFENDLNFENLSILLNDIGILSHPLTNEQKVCLEYPNISSESKDLDMLGENLKKLETEGDKETKSQNNELTLNISKNKNYTINVENLFHKFKNICKYSQETFTNSLKIFVSIFNNFNEDIFKWNLEDNDLFNSSNKIQFFLVKDIIKNNMNMNDQIDILYKKHLENDIKMSINKSNNREITQTDDFADDFEDTKRQQSKNSNNEDSFGDNMIIGDIPNEDEIIFKNIYFLMNFFNFMNSFYINDYNIDNLMRNISLFNSYVINDIKILLLIHFNLCIQINLTLSKQTVDNFLGISSTNKTPNATTISSTMGPLAKSINFFSNSNINNKNGINTYIPSLFFIDFYYLEQFSSPQENNNQNNVCNKETIILLNFILKSFLWTYFIRNKISLKIYIKIFNIEQFSFMKETMIINQNIKTTEKIYELTKDTNYINILNDPLSKEYLLLSNADFELTNELKINQIEEFFKIYFVIFINCNMISFEIKSKDDEFSLNNFIEELNTIIWLFKFYLKIRKYKFKKYTFTFIANSFSIAFKKNKINQIEETYTKEITLFMGISQYKPIELIKYLSDINNFNSTYKIYKSIIKSCNEYKNYDIGIRLFKNDIINEELRYYIAMLILKLKNYINFHKDLYKKLVLYENKIINPLNCAYLNIKKKVLKMKNAKNENDMNFKIKEKNAGGVLKKIDIFSKLKKNTNDSNADRNDINISNFYKSLTTLGLNHEEKMVIYGFVKEVKYYFTEFVVFLCKNIILDKKNMSFDPVNILEHFNNNKCFIIITDNTSLDLYIYLTDSFDINFLSKEENNNEKNNIINNKALFFNAIISNIKILKFACKENFDNNLGHIQLRNVNIILNKSTLLQNEYFQDYKSLFSENNNIYVLDEYTKTHCIFGETHISLMSNIDENNLENKDIYNDYFMAFFTIFLNSYQIIKYINDKKVRKYDKLDIIFNDKILQIKNGNIQIKEIFKEKDTNNNTKSTNDINKINEIKNDNKEVNDDNINTNNINNEEINNIEKENELNIINDNENENNKNKNINFIHYNLFKIKEFFQYQNSYPIIDFMLMKESEISNLSFLFFTFEEIFLTKKNEKETQKTIIKKILKFFIRYKSSKYIPLIFTENYFDAFLNCFNLIINRKESSSHRENTKNQLFENIILFPLENKNKDQLINKINKTLEEKNILKNLFKTIHLFIINTNKYSKNIIGKLFKCNRVVKTMKEFGTQSKISNNNNDFFIIYEINEELLDNVIKINKKKIKVNDGQQEINDSENAKIDDIEKDCKIF